ncbi:hypothetical protein H9623_03815 [Oerskovia sp. Sa1BUA8]|uniref:Uncharacterized protein n=1 Tax=Oerskovia douganii TaxID=2762210 RepID=A0A9D5U739_9CELL|nr:hypothetical protein [Oerskovia douganii]MBE7699433.1 hypothetical protein [Oerskovia douganii]
MTTEKQSHESDDADRTQALPPVDPTVELPVTPGEPGEHEGEPDEHAAAETDADATQVLPVGQDDPDATQVIETGRAPDDLADELFRAEPTQALPVAPPTQALPVSEPTLTLPAAPPAPGTQTGALPVWEASTHTQAYPVQDAPVDPEPDVVEGPATPPSAPSPAPSPAVDPAAQWNATAQQRAQHPDPTLEDPRNRGLRVGTVVWGFVIVAVGAGILALALGATYDLDLALIALLSVAGLVLVVGSIVSSSRRSARERARR